jgi:hypothetical protein
MPDNLRYVSYIGMKENDVNIMIASVISLGSTYREEDIKPLINVLTKDIADINTQILHNLTVYSSPTVLTQFFEHFLI